MCENNFNINENDDETQFLKENLNFEIGTAHTVFNREFTHYLFQFKVARRKEGIQANTYKLGDFERFCDISQNYQLFIKILDKKIAEEGTNGTNFEEIIYWNKAGTMKFCFDKQSTKGFRCRKEEDWSLLKEN